MKSLLKIRSTTRIAITLGCICASVIWCAFGLHIFPNWKSRVISQRIELCESIAISIATLANVNQTKEIQPLLETIKQRNPQIISIGVRDLSGDLIIDLGNHKRNWSLTRDGHSGEDEMQLGLVAEGKHNSNLEISFVSARDYSGMGVFFPASAVLFCSAASACLFWFYLSRVLKHLNPSKVVPTRVQSALNSLVEGLILINENEEIVLSNTAFASLIDRTNDELMGVNPAEFPWCNHGKKDSFPWSACMEQQAARNGDILTLQINGKERKFVVNTSPVENESGKCAGVLISFDDVTAFEEKQQELGKMLNLLRASRDEVQRQNKELQVLASLDPLTGCLNRRAFFERFKHLWSSQVGDTLTVIMVDIDKFKSINDQFGHSVGDEIIKGVADILGEFVSENGLLCRFGGEEFCLLMVKQSIDQTFELAESIRATIEAKQISGLTLTCSLGVSARMFGAMDTQHLLDQADQCLYVAKRSGRNQVSRWDQCTAEQLAAVEQDEQSKSDQANMHYSAVMAMLAALAIRDRATAEHSQRVANLAVAVAETMLPVSMINDLEIACLLHDVGKIGLPDSVLLKREALDEKDWQLIKSNEQMSIKIVESALANSFISDMLRLRSLNAHETGELIATEKVNPDSILPSKILSVCDAFDSLISSRPYRSAKSHSAALEQLTLNANEEVDAAIVSRLTTVLHENPAIVETPTLICNNPKAAYLISGQVENLNQAIAARDFEEISLIVNDIVQHAMDDQVEPIVKAAQILSKTLHQNETEVDQLIKMTNEVMNLCRATRSTMIGPRDVTQSSPKTDTFSDEDLCELLSSL